MTKHLQDAIFARFRLRQRSRLVYEQRKLRKPAHV